MSLTVDIRLERGAFRLEVQHAFPARGVSAVFGASGSGKTTLLRVVAGLERGASGRLGLDDRIWQDGRRFVPPHRRAVGFVFQEPSLFPHLDVRRNVAYGARRAPGGRRRLGVAEAVALLGLDDLMDRRPQQLSGGEQQRVAIARALAAGPDVLLMDEPLASLDAARKAEILPWFARLHRRLEIPVLYVSHAPDEVLRLGDHLVLLDGGRAAAAGEPGEILTRLDLAPARDPEARSVLAAVVAGRDEAWGLVRLDSPAGPLLLPDDEAEGLEPGRAVRLLVRAGDVSLALARPEGSSILNVLPAVVEAVAAGGGARATVRLRAGGAPLLARVTRKSADALDLRPGREVFAQIKSVALDAR